MTEFEAKGCIQGKLDCMNKCDVFDCKGTDECESCNYCYSQGNFGEQKQAFEIGIKALEKQIAKKVDIPPCNTCKKELCDCGCEHFITTFRDNYQCPNCESTYVYLSDYCLKFDYCPDCGQKLDWGNEE